MKSILVPIDFSKPSADAAHYALHLARYMGANITLCNAIYVPVEIPTGSFGSWAGYDVTTLKEEGMVALEEVALELRNELRASAMPNAFHPEVTCLLEVGGVTDVIAQLAEKSNANLLVMGSTGAGALSRILLGSISRAMIDLTRLPLVLVPEGSVFGKIEKIAFASSLIADDIEVIHCVSGFAHYFHADLLVAHVSYGSNGQEPVEENSDGFLRDMRCKINYDKLYYRQVDQADVDRGLGWLSTHGRIDLLVMVHHKKGLIENIFSSHTHARANHLDIPLLIMPAGLRPVF
jgi:nucleotide-binding universal stress UspA family protein